MPMHRPLPDFVQQNHIKRNFYEDESNKAQVDESMKFLNKIDPELIKSVPMAKEILQEALKKEALKRVKKKTKVKSDVFRADGLGARESQEEGETEYDIFLSDDMDDNAIHTQNGRKVSVPRHIKQKSMKKAKTMGN